MKGPGYSGVLFVHNPKNISKNIWNFEIKVAILHYQNQSTMTSRKLAESFNKPYQTAVAIITEHIGDDNDYSCFLNGVLKELYKAGKVEMAYKLALTDTMSLEGLTLEQFKENMEYYLNCDKEREEHEKACSKSYSRD